MTDQTKTTKPAQDPKTEASQLFIALAKETQSPVRKDYNIMTNAVAMMVRAKTHQYGPH